MKYIELPTLLFWENGNSWYGSLDNTRFFVKPEVPGGAEEKQLTVRVWRGPLEMALSEILAAAAFPLTEEGLNQTAAWLEEQANEKRDCKKSPAGFRARRRESRIIHFSRRHVRREKYFSARKRASCPPQADCECDAAGRSLFKKVASPLF